MSTQYVTRNHQPTSLGPDNPARKPLSARETDEFYLAAKSMNTLRHELTGRTLLDYGLRSGELAHSMDSWVKQERHPRSREKAWCIDIPRGEVCYGGNRDAGQQNEGGADLHNTDSVCTECTDRSYDDKDWVDDKFHRKKPWHPKSKASFSTKVWAIPKETAEETARLLSDFLKPGKQWPVGTSQILLDVGKIVERANERAKNDPELHGIDRHVHTHALRHTFGCRLAAAGFEPTARMRQLRHNDYEMSLYYSQAWGLRHRDSIRSGEWEAVEDH